MLTEGHNSIYIVYNTNRQFICIIGYKLFTIHLQSICKQGQIVRTFE